VAPRSMPRLPQSLLAKVATVSAIGMGIGFGTCGLGLLTGAHYSVVISAGAILFFLSLASLAITALIALGKSISESFRR